MAIRLRAPDRTDRAWTRAGAVRVISFVCGRELFQIRAIERYTNSRIHRLASSPRPRSRKHERTCFSAGSHHDATGRFHWGLNDSLSRPAAGSALQFGRTLPSAAWPQLQGIEARSVRPSSREASRDRTALSASPRAD